jgi:integrase
VINETLAPIWIRIPETGSRVRQRIEKVITWVKEGMPLPQALAEKQKKHHEAMPFLELPGFMTKLRSEDGIPCRSARALEFLILTAARTSDVLGMTDAEISDGVWTIPAARHKTGKEFQIPLSKRALEIIRTVPREAGNPHIFAGSKSGQPMSNMTMLKFLKERTGNGYTVHGFRSTFRDWAGDRTHYPREVIETAMSHMIKNKVEAAYRRSSAIEKRRVLMEDWSKFCSSPAIVGAVVPLHKRAG